jgi:lipoprotein-anchoring transpeptidase ErfK/SrfK
MKKVLSVFLCLMAAFVFTLGSADAAKKRYKARQPAAVQIHVDVSSQSMSVRVNGLPYAYWRVSTAKPGYYTPRGSYGVQRMHRVYYSRKYDNAPMPHSIFFRGPYAIHGTYHTKQLGRVASRGCVRLAPGNAARLFALVQKYGYGRTRITVSN